MRNIFQPISEHRWLFLLALLLLFFQPYRLGLKIDPATYGALAKQIELTGTYWPLGLYDGFFKEFSDHPPLVVWLMSFAMRLPLKDEWAVHLLSRLCCLFTLLVGVLTLKLNQRTSNKDTFKKEVTFLLVALSWMDWLKFAGAGQLEGPVSLWLMALLYFLTRHGQKTRRLSLSDFLLWIFLGSLGFLIKGVFTLPVLVGLAVFTLVFRKSALAPIMASLLGWGFGVALLFVLDQSIKTTFISTYFGTQVFGTVVSGGIRGVEPLSFSFFRIFSALKTWVEIQVKYSFLWSIPFLIAVPFVLWKKRRAEIDPVLALALVIYFSFMGPIALAAFKLPHWLVPVYPIGALAFSILFPWERLRLPKSTESVFKGLVLVLLLIHSFVPFPTTNRYPRGEEFTLNRDYILENGLQFSRLDLFPDDEKGMPILFQKAYASFYFLPLKVSDLLTRPCDKNLALISWENWNQNHEQLRKLGWEESPIRRGQSKFVFCSL
ncbi:MAG: ArnT family glycosyltransferase [Pseudomonadota bacterium]